MPVWEALGETSRGTGGLAGRHREYGPAYEVSAGRVAAMTYPVVAKRWKRGWELHIDGVGVTQSTTLAEAEELVRDYLELDGLDPSADVTVVPKLGGLEAHVAAVRARVAHAQDETRAAAAASRSIARELRKAGLSVTDTAIVLGAATAEAPLGTLMLNIKPAMPPR